ncbi:MAG: 16S rRNA (guanine(527)-N(7))-methyltransferase RsmG [Solobacterium sp.]|nr:16S rRNA (guanine(527)-N(7))-methyltransferase RsmG [Solobacterium sp.]
MTIEELKQELVNRKIPCSPSLLEGSRKLTVLLKEWNAKFNLTAIDDPEEVYEKHILDCLIPLGYETITGTVADVGSGAGFPGLVWALALPACSITLIEPTAKRCRYLEEAVKELGLTNVTVVNQRAEEVVSSSRESFDVVTARAVANLPVLSELCVPLVKPGGFFCALKGAQGKEEAKLAEFALNRLGCSKPKIVETALPCGDERTIIHADKLRSTPKQYPRNYAQIKHKPLLEKPSHA